MSKKDFINLAIAFRVLPWAVHGDALAMAVRSVTAVFEAVYPRFDARRFVLSCMPGPDVHAEAQRQLDWVLDGLGLGVSE